MGAQMDDQSLLLVIDVQNDFCTGGALAVPDGEAVVAPVNRLVCVFEQVAMTQDWHPPGHSSFASSHKNKSPLETVELDHGTQTLWPDHCIQGTPGAAFHQDLDTRRARIIVRKGCNPHIDSYSAFLENDGKTPTGLGAALHELGITHLYLAGLATDFCVGFSALDARKLGFEVFVLEEACRAIDVKGSLAQIWQQMNAAGVKRQRLETLL